MFPVYFITDEGNKGRKVFNSEKKKNAWIASVPPYITILEGR
jgi:hypothetical protein